MYSAAFAHYTAPDIYSSDTMERAYVFGASSTDVSSVPPPAYPTCSWMSGAALRNSISSYSTLLPPGYENSSYPITHDVPHFSYSAAPQGDSAPCEDDAEFLSSADFSPPCSSSSSVDSLSSVSPIRTEHTFSVFSRVKLEPLDDENCFIMEQSSPSVYTTPPQTYAPPTEVPLRTQAPPEMRRMMSVFRLNPFATLNGAPCGNTLWQGGEARPLDEEPRMFEFYLQLNDDEGLLPPLPEFDEATECCPFNSRSPSPDLIPKIEEWDDRAVYDEYYPKQTFPPTPPVNYWELEHPREAQALSSAYCSSPVDTWCGARTDASYYQHPSSPECVYRFFALSSTNLIYSE
ncbi:hypothetical protein FISHEDRAFT_74208 [Fistulina hepatica ATCC 64428]|uniref:Uncharacterized protein n=1 Tax=Fistulina hepatica ATCC 64428 TaxID=1128425 RepID=A0A0D7ADA9_9AGAR|nr:hypothetical protein FISHEDRAFT_74208 [Fistulina hepatica ATCC 64428]